MSARRWLIERELDTRWMKDAACTEVPGLPWTENLGRVPRVLVELMAATCRSCPVLARCEEFVDEGRITAGWWAGASRNDRTVHSKEPTGYARRRTKPGMAVEGAA